MPEAANVVTFGIAYNYFTPMQYMLDTADFRK